MSNSPQKPSRREQLRIDLETLLADSPPPPLKAVLLTDKQVVLNAELAQKYLELPVYEVERDAREPHVQVLVDAMNNQTFNAHLVILATAELDGTIYKVNGQHTSWAVWLMNGVKPGYALTVRELHYRVANGDELRALYSSFDRNLVRTNAHATAVLTTNTPELAGLAPSVLKRIVPGLKLWLYPESHVRERLSANQVATLMRRTYAQQCHAVGKFVASGRLPHMFRAPVIAAQLATFDVDPEQAVEFWDVIATGLNLDSQADPRWRLRELLQTTRLSNTRNAVFSGGRLPSGALRLLNAESMYRCCIVAWNKWRTGESMSTALRAPKERPQPR